MMVCACSRAHHKSNLAFNQSYATPFWSSAVHSDFLHREYHHLHNLFCIHGAQEREHEEDRRQCKGTTSFSQEYSTRLMSGVSQKAEAAAAKAAVANAQVAAEEDDNWSKGAKSNAKK